MAQETVRLPTEVERQRVQDVIDRHAAHQPDGVQRVTFDFGEDWTGHPAVYVNLFVRKNLTPTKQKIRELNEYVKALHDDIIDDEAIGFWPYSRTFGMSSAPRRSTCSSAPICHGLGAALAAVEAG